MFRFHFPGSPAIHLTQVSSYFIFNNLFKLIKWASYHNTYLSKHKPVLINWCAIRPTSGMLWWRYGSGNQINCLGCSTHGFLLYFGSLITLKEAEGLGHTVPLPSAAILANAVPEVCWTVPPSLCSSVCGRSHVESDWEGQQYEPTLLPGLGLADIPNEAGEYTCCLPDLAVQQVNGAILPGCSCSDTELRTTGCLHIHQCTVITAH